VRVSPDLEELQQDLLGHPHQRRREEERRSLSSLARCVGEERRSLPTSCVVSAEKRRRHESLNTPSPAKHRIRSTPPLQKITVPCPVEKKKVVTASRLVRNWETTSAAHACHCHQTCINQKALSHESMTLHLPNHCLLCPQPPHRKKEKLFSSTIKRINKRCC
jgi:hypothetical protein